MEEQHVTWLARMGATCIEIIGGQPLDRWKVNQQLPSAIRLSYRELLKAGLYTASCVSIIQRCGFYIPGMFYISDLTKKHVSTNPIVVGLAVSTIMTPSISIFENLKTTYQTIQTNTNSITGTLTVLYKRYGFRGLFPTIPATFLREGMFAMGLCSLVPIVDGYFHNVVLSGIVTGIVVQTLSHPFDTIKTRQEHTKYTFFQTFRSIQPFRHLWFGLYPRCIRGAWTVTCLHYCTKSFTALIEEVYP